MKSICPQTEKAFAAFFTKKKPGTVLASCSTYAGLGANPQEIITPPAIVCCADAPMELAPGANIYELTLRTIIETQIDEKIGSNIGEDLHRLRVEKVRELLDDTEGAILAMNHPEDDPDTRTVKDYTLSATVFEDEYQTQVDRTLRTTFSYYVCASPVNETPS